MSFLINPFLGGSGGGAFGTLWKTGAIDHTKVGSVDHTDFPMLFSGTYPDLADVAHGGLLNNVNNFRFCTNGTGGALAKFERESHDLTTGAVKYWVKVSTVSHSADSNFYPTIDTSDTTDRSDAANVWTANFTRVAHMGDGSTLSGTDASGNGNFTVTNATATTGQIYGGGNFSTASSQYLKNAAAAATAYPLTISGWAKLANTTMSVGEERIIGAVAKTANLEEWWLSYYNNAGSKILRAVTQGGGGVMFRSSAGLTLDTNWHHLVGVFTDSTHVSIYMDGANADNALSGSGVTPSGVTDTYIGGLFYNTSNFYGPFQGVLDEVRFSNVARTASWILAEYNNQTSPSTFYSLT